MKQITLRNRQPSGQLNDTFSWRLFLKTSFLASCSKMSRRLPAVAAKSWSLSSGGIIVIDLLKSTIRQTTTPIFTPMFTLFLTRTCYRDVAPIQFPNVWFWIDNELSTTCIEVKCPNTFFGDLFLCLHFRILLEFQKAPN